MKPPLPINESARLDALHQYDILDTLPEKSFDDLTRLAAYIFEFPIALISLVDADRQWFKSRVGIDASETSRDVSFCAHAILQPDLFIVEDASQDVRFANNPLVTADPQIRFYAGAPLITPDGLKLGTLCLIDSVPRKLSFQQRQALQILAHQIMAQLELRRKSIELTTTSFNVRSSQALPQTGDGISLTKLFSSGLAGITLIPNMIDVFLEITELAEDEQERF